MTDFITYYTERKAGVIDTIQFTNFHIKVDKTDSETIEKIERSMKHGRRIRKWEDVKYVFAGGKKVFIKFPIGRILDICRKSEESEALITTIPFSGDKLSFEKIISETHKEEHLMFGDEELIALCFNEKCFGIENNPFAKTTEMLKKWLAEYGVIQGSTTKVARSSLLTRVRELFKEKKVTRKDIIKLYNMKGRG